MQLPTFIGLFETFDKAMAYPNSPQMTEYSFEGVQLLPNHPFKYIQRTYADNGIEIEDFTVYLCDMCGTRLWDVSDYFSIERNFNDPVTGIPQVEWSLYNVDYDAGYQPVYLEIETGANQYYYSSPFYLTDEYKDYTSRWDYRNKDTDTMLSSQLRLFFRQKKSEQEVSNYNPVSSGSTYTASSRLTPFERWTTDVIEINVVEEFKKIFLCREVYSLDFNGTLPVKTGLYEAIESPDLEADENFAEQEILLSRNYSITYDPNALPVTPPGPSPGDPFITLQAVQSMSSSQVKYTFTFGNFITTPSSFAYQYSLDGVEWSSSSSSIASPQTIVVLNNQSINLYYRIYHYGTGTTSNVLQLPVEGINLTNIVKTSGSRKVAAYFTLNNFFPTTGQQLIIDVSTDGSNWIEAAYFVNYNSPKYFEEPYTLVPFTFYRMRYPALGLTSNVVET